MKDIEALLREHAFTQTLAPETLATIAGCAKNRVFNAGEYVFREGQSADAFYLIRHGTVALENVVPGRGPVSFLTLKEGEMLGVSWLLPPYRWTYDARAVELTRAFAFDAVCLRGKCETDPRVGYEMMKCFVPPLVERLQTARLQALDLYGKREKAGLSK